MEGKEIYVLGIGHNSINVIELALSCGYKIAGLIHYNDSRSGEDYFGYPIMGSFDEFLTPGFVAGKKFALSMGDIRIRGELFNRIIGMQGEFPSLIHKSCYISSFAKIGRGVQIQPHCVVEAATSIGDDSTLIVNSVVHHNSSVGAHNLISGNVLVGAYCKIGDYVHIGQGAIIVSGKVEEIGNHSVLGAGAVLLENMERNSVYVGNPAKLLRKL